MKSRLVFLGPPGAGKGTQADLLCANNKIAHLSTGDMLRAEVEAGSVLGKEAELVMNRGDLVSDELVLSIVEKTLNNQNNGGWLLDGFPRNVVQAKALELLLTKLQQPIDAAILLELDDEDLIARLLARGRSDDTETVIRKRLVVYREKTEPLVEFYKQQGLLSKIQASGTVEDISLRIFQKLGPSL